MFNHTYMTVLTYSFRAQVDTFNFISTSASAMPSNKNGSLFPLEIEPSSWVAEHKQSNTYIAKLNYTNTASTSTCYIVYAQLIKRYVCLYIDMH